MADSPYRIPIAPEAKVATRAQTGMILNCCESKVDDLIRRGDLKVVRLGGARAGIRVTLASIDAYLTGGDGR